MLLPVIKRINTKEVCFSLIFLIIHLSIQIQSRIDSFFTPLLFEGTSNQSKKNTRLKSAFDLLKEKTRQAKENDIELNLSEDDDDDDTPIPERNESKKRKRTKNNTKLMDNVFDVVKKTKRRSKKTTNTAPILSDEETF